MAVLTPTRPLPDSLARLLSLLVADDWTATSPLVLDPDAERMARTERQDP